jgi:hypothetical protein
MQPGAQPRCVVRQSILHKDAWIFEFDPASPGGRGGCAVALVIATELASISGVHRNDHLSRRSTGGLIAEELGQTPLPRPKVLEAYNVEETTACRLMAGEDGQGTLLGNTLEDTAKSLGAKIERWETVPDIGAIHLRVHLSYP